MISHVAEGSSLADRILNSTTFRQRMTPLQAKEPCYCAITVMIVIHEKKEIQLLTDNINSHF
jgi:hypothetical protein